MTQWDAPSSTLLPLIQRHDFAVLFIAIAAALSRNDKMRTRR